MLENLKIENFEGNAGKTYFLTAEKASFDLKLKEVTPLGPTRNEAGVRNQAFSLLFEGPADPVLGQSLYKIKEDTLGEIELFLVPVGPSKEGMHYEAIFT